MPFEKAYKEVVGLQGWMPKFDCEELFKYVQGLEGLIVEIGSFMGISTKIMALAAPKTKIISIDPYLKVHSSIKLTPKRVKKRCVQVMKGHNWELIQAKSQDVGKTWDKQIDFLLIDGDHRYKQLMKDIELFVPHVKTGGYVFFHDYSNGWDGPFPKKYNKKQEENGEAVKLVVWKIKDKYFSNVYTDPYKMGWAIGVKK